MIKRSKLFKRTNGLCWYCGQEAKNRDHVIPLSRGGTNVNTNLVPCCKPCNSMKGNMTIAEFRADLLIRWQNAQIDRKAMRRTVAMFGVMNFRFYFEVAGLTQPEIPEDCLARLKPKGYSLLKRGIPTDEEPPHTPPAPSPICHPRMG